MKKNLIRLITALAVMALAFTGAKAQDASARNYALIDMQYLTEQIPQYKSATEEIEKKAKEWNKEINQLNEQAKQHRVA